MNTTSAPNSGTRARAGWLAAAAVIVLVCMAQLWRVFALRVEYGDVYPAYSTHRADPMGAQAFYEALATLPPLQVRRHERDIMELNQGNNTTLFILGVPDTADPFEVIRSIEGFVLTGGRLVVAYYPLSGEYWDYERERLAKKKEKEGEAEEKVTEGEELLVNIKDRWGFELNGNAWPGKPKKFQVRKTAGITELPDALPWRSASYFEKVADHWKTVYARDGLPVVIERHWGGGSIVVCADSYFISNEALQKERPTAFLTWLVGPNTRIVLDESHLGLVRTPGLMDLVRRYRLEPVLMVFLLVGLLFVWKRMSSLVPRHDADYLRRAAADETGKEAFSGLYHLVRRGVPPRRLLHTCYEEWRRDFAQDPRCTPAVHQDMLGLARDEENDASAVVARYKTMVKRLHERK